MNSVCTLELAHIVVKNPDRVLASHLADVCDETLKRVFYHICDNDLPEWDREAVPTDDPHRISEAIMAAFGPKPVIDAPALAAIRDFLNKQSKLFWDRKRAQEADAREAFIESLSDPNRFYIQQNLIAYLEPKAHDHAESHKLTELKYEVAERQHFKKSATRKTRAAKQQAKRVAAKRRNQVNLGRISAALVQLESI